MSEVQRWLIQKTPIGTMMKPNPDGNWIDGEDFDRVTAEREAALLQVETITADRDAEKQMKAKARIQRDVQTTKATDLHERLTAADERADVLVTALSKIKLRLDAFVEAERDMPSPSVEVCQSIAYAALKPAEGQLNQCDGCQAGIPVVNGAHRMGKPGAYPDTMSCTAKLYKPAEGGGDE